VVVDLMRADRVTLSHSFDKSQSSFKDTYSRVKCFFSKIYLVWLQCNIHERATLEGCEGHPPVNVCGPVKQ